jgi:hypothetical protein
MSDKATALKETEAFVKNVLRDRFHQRADAATIRAVAQKVARTFPSAKSNAKVSKGKSV